MISFFDTALIYSVSSLDKCCVKNINETHVLIIQEQCVDMKCCASLKEELDLLLHGCHYNSFTSNKFTGQVNQAGRSCNSRTLSIRLVSGL